MNWCRKLFDVDLKETNGGGRYNGLSNLKTLEKNDIVKRERSKKTYQSFKIGHLYKYLQGRAFSTFVKPKITVD